MGNMMRSSLATVAGVLLAGLVIASGELVAQRLFPMPARLNVTDSETMAAELERDRRRLQQSSNLAAQGRYQDVYFQAQAIAIDLPFGQAAAVSMFWLIGAVAAGWLETRIARRALMFHATIVGTLLLAAGSLSMVLLRRPFWLWVPGVALLPLASYAGGRLALRTPPRQQPHQ